MARDLARHISAIPPSALPPGFLEKAGLWGRPDEILGRHSMTSLIRRYSALLRVHLQHTEANLEKLERGAALERKRMEVRCTRLTTSLKTILGEFMPCLVIGDLILYVYLCLIFTRKLRANA